MSLKSVLALVALLAFAWAAPSVAAWPPVCLEKEVSAAGVTVEAMVTCGPEVTITQCPPVGYGPCWTTTFDPLP